MLPYFEQTTIVVGPITIFVWGLFIALGIGAGILVARREVRREKLSFDHVLDITIWAIVGAFLGARLAHVFFYEPTFFLAHPVEILKVWHGGLSSVGGITGGILGALLFVRRHKLSVKVYADVVARSMPVAWIVARFGCYLTHMHPGVHSNRWFAVNYPDGGRFDLGLLESLVWVGIGCVLWFVPRFKRRGMYLALVPLMYAPARFGLDFLRTTEGMMADARYGGLTPAQYGMIFLFIIGLFLFYDARRTQ